MSSLRPKVNPPICDICMSSVRVKQRGDGAWYCLQSRCLRESAGKPIMVTSIDKDEPVSPGLFSRLWAFLTRDLSEDRRPKHPRPATSPCPQVSRPGLHHIVLRNGSSIAICEDIDHKDKMRSPKDMDVGRPPSGGSGVLPAPPTIKCPRCKGEKHEDATDLSDGRAFAVERFICESCGMAFTYEDVVIAEKKSSDGPGGEAPAPIDSNIAGFGGNEAEITAQLSKVTKEASGSGDELESTGCVGPKKFVPRPPKVSSVEDRPRSRIEGDVGEMARSYRDERRRSGGVPMCPEDSDVEEKKDLNQIATEKGWRKPKTEPAPKTSSAWWMAIKWIFGVGASIGTGWLLEWAFF